MSVAAQATELRPGADPTARADDLSGRDRIVWNVLAGWAGHLVLVAAGFIMPRLIDRHVGQAGLGVWDFAWSVVGYFALAGLGIGSSVNRYVAGYRAAGDLAGLRRAVSSVMAVQLVAAALVGLATAAVAWGVPPLLEARFGVERLEARLVLGLLGASVTVQMAFDTYRGVITGCHRWDLHTLVNAASHGLALAGMLVALGLDAGLAGLGAAYLAAVVVTEGARTVIAYRVCPGLRVAAASVSWAEARAMLAFGGKSLVEGLSRLLLTQASSIVVGSYLGPAALAVYARPWALVRHTEAIVNKLAVVLTPTASSLWQSGRREDLRELLIRSVRYGAYLGTPMMLVLAILGDPILQLWMGPRYAAGPVLPILAAGGLLPAVQQPVVSILMGVNLHGRTGLVTLAMAGLGAGAGLLAVGVFGWGTAGAALAVALPLLAGNGVLLPLYACRRLGVPLGQYVVRAFAGPLACGVPVAAILVAARVALGDRPLAAVTFGGLAVGLVMAPVYWRWVLPSSVRGRLARGAEGLAGAAWRGGGR